MSETPKDYEGGESPKEPIKYEAIIAKLDPLGYEIPDYPPSELEWRLADDIKHYRTRLRDLTPEEQNLFSHPKSPHGSRDYGHILRMLRYPAEATKNFAMAYCRRNDKNLFDDEQDIRKIKRLINGGHGSDVRMFWTFAPYLFKAFREKGIDEDRAMRLTLAWAKSGSFNWKDESDPVHLKGLEWLNQYDQKSYVLSTNPQHVSHQFTEQEARRIADLLLAENEK